MKSAFSLIELMVVITIVGLIAAIATPLYKRYTTRTQMATLLNDVAIRQKIIEQNHAMGVVYSETSSFFYPIGGADNPPFVYYANIGWKGCIEYTLSHNLIGLGAPGQFTTLIYCPTETDGVIIWNCGYHPQAPGSSEVRELLFPVNCQGESNINVKDDF